MRIDDFEKRKGSRLSYKENRKTVRKGVINKRRNNATNSKDNKRTENGLLNLTITREVSVE
jgi:hypothetical protein